MRTIQASQANQLYCPRPLYPQAYPGQAVDTADHQPFLELDDTSSHAGNYVTSGYCPGHGDSSKYDSDNGVGQEGSSGYGVESGCDSENGVDGLSYM